MKKFIAGIGTSTIPNPETGQIKPYEDAKNEMDMRVFSSKEHFEMIDSQFREVKDFQGNSMLEIARRYWDDPDYAEQMRQDIEKGRRRGH